MGRAGGGGGPERAADPRHPGDGCGGGGRRLQSGDLEIVSETFLVSLNCVEGGHSSALGPDIGFLRGIIRRGSDTIRGRDGGGGDVGAVADGAIAPGPPDADVIILVTQMGLGGGDSRGSRVPIKTSHCSYKIKHSSSHNVYMVHLPSESV